MNDKRVGNIMKKYNTEDKEIAIIEMIDYLEPIITEIIDLAICKNTNLNEYKEDLLQSSRIAIVTNINKYTDNIDCELFFKPIILREINWFVNNLNQLDHISRRV